MDNVLMKHAVMSRDIKEAAGYCRSLGDLIDDMNKGAATTGEARHAAEKVMLWYALIGKKLGIPEVV